MRQVFVIHGGGTFATYDRYVESLKTVPVELETIERRDWKKNLSATLGEGYEVVLQQFPNKWNAQYAEWKLWFERCVPLLQDNVILIGHSLGGIFLAKYLSENGFTKKIIATLLVAAPFEAINENNLIQFVLPASLQKFQQEGGKIFLYHSKDDRVVNFTELAKYQAALPNATARVFDDRGHFNQEEFPELVADIKAL